MVAADFVNGLAFRTIHFRGDMFSVILWDILVAVVAIVLLEWTVRAFDRCLGRMPKRGTRLDADPVENARSITPSGSALKRGRTFPRRPPLSHHRPDPVAGVDHGGQGAGPPRQYPADRQIHS